MPGNYGRLNVLKNLRSPMWTRKLCTLSHPLSLQPSNLFRGGKSESLSLYIIFSYIYVQGRFKGAMKILSISVKPVQTHAQRSVTHSNQFKRCWTSRRWIQNEIAPPFACFNVAVEIAVLTCFDILYQYLFCSIKPFRSEISCLVLPKMSKYWVYKWILNTAVKSNLPSGDWGCFLCPPGS